jgi:hypothetical protein
LDVQVGAIHHGKDHFILKLLRIQDG